MNHTQDGIRFIAGLIQYSEWADEVSGWCREEHFAIHWHWRMFQAIQECRGDRSQSTSPYRLMNALGIMYGQICSGYGSEPEDLSAEMTLLSKALDHPPKRDEFDSVCVRMRGRDDDADLTADAVDWCRLIPYDRYLKTRHWRVTRGYALGRAGHRCQVCNADGEGLDVHHRTYERRGEESPDDVIALCRGCHTLFHDNGKLARPAL